jgi:hypothetical protein
MHPDAPGLSYHKKSASHCKWRFLPSLTDGFICAFQFHQAISQKTISPTAIKEKATPANKATQSTLRLNIPIPLSLTIQTQNRTRIISVRSGTGWNPMPLSSDLSERAIAVHRSGDATA